MNTAGVGHQSAQALLRSAITPQLPPIPLPVLAVAVAHHGLPSCLRRPTNSRCRNPYLASTPLLRLPARHLNPSRVWHFNLFALGASVINTFESEHFSSC
jgi:hypothetical protein